ncbi:MAG: hypothetical protein U1E92_03860 [Moraxella osloensis]
MSGDIEQAIAAGATIVRIWHRHFWEQEISANDRVKRQQFNNF